jgi:hypothetical protein
VACVYTFEPRVDESLDQGLEFTIQIDSATTFSNLTITNRGSGYTPLDNIHITRTMVGGSGNTIFASFKVTEVGDPLVTSNSLQFVGGQNNLELETGEGIMTTERFLAVTSTTVRDQASGILYTTVPDEPPGAQSYIVGQTFTPSTRDFFNRQLVAELSPKGHRVHKELDINPSYNQHKIYYSTLSNALAVGTKVLGETSRALGIVMQHDTTRNNAILKYTTAATGTGVAGTYYNVSGTSSASGSGATFDITLDTTTSVSSVLIRNTGSGFVLNETITIPISAVHPTSTSTSTFATITVSEVDSDYIIVHRDQKDWGKAGSQFSGTEVIQNLVPTEDDSSTTNYFTATSIELHWTPEDIVTKQEPTAITADTYITSQAQKTASEGGADTDEVWTASGINPGSTAGYHGRGRTITSAASPNETYDSEMKQRKINIVSSPIYSSSTTQRGRALSAGNHTKTPLNQRGARTEGTNTIVAGDTAPPYLAINGTSLRLDDIKNSVSEIPGDSSVTIRRDSGSRTGVNMSSGNNWGYRPAGQKLYESTNFILENIISEANEKFIMEEYPGRITMSSYPGDKGGILLNEDATQVLCETETNQSDDIQYFVSEESTQIGSYNLISESGERVVHESGNTAVNSSGVNTESGLGSRFLSEEALMIGRKESNQSGPTIGDLGNMMFTENYGIMNKVYEEDFYVLDETDSDNILMEDNTLLVSESDDVMLETGEHMLQESPSEGLRISDISSMYPNRRISNLERELGRKTNLNYSASVQTG